MSEPTTIIDGSVITALFTGLAAIIGAISTLIYRNFRDRKQGPVVTCAECAEHRKAMNRRIDDLIPMLNRISRQIEDGQKRDEERAVQLHRRLDPIVERVASVAAEIDMLKERK